MSRRSRRERARKRLALGLKAEGTTLAGRANLATIVAMGAVITAAYADIPDLINNALRVWTSHHDPGGLSHPTFWQSIIYLAVIAIVGLACAYGLGAAVERHDTE